MYCGEWIESHALHVFLLHAPDFLGFESAWAMAARPPRGGRGRPEDQGDGQRAAAGDRRPRDPPDQRPGRRLLQGARARRISRRWCPGSRRRGSWRASRCAWVRGLDFPDFEQDYEFVALRHPDRYAIEDGRLVSSSGLDIGPGEYEEHFAEEQVPHSTALQSRMRDGGTYFLGPMARYSLNSAQLSDVAREAAEEAGLGEAVPQPVQVDRRPGGGDPLRASTRRCG